MLTALWTRRAASARLWRSVIKRLPQLWPSCGPRSLSCCSATHCCKPSSIHPYIPPPILPLSSLSASCLIPHISPRLPPLLSSDPSPPTSRLLDGFMIMERLGGWEECASERYKKKQHGIFEQLSRNNLPGELPLGRPVEWLSHRQV